MRTKRFLLRIALSSAFAALWLPRATATVLHNFNNTPLVTTFIDQTSTITVSSAAGVDGNALRLDFNLAGGNYAGATLNVAGHDFVALGVAGLRFQYRLSPPVRNFEVLLVDGDNVSDTLCDKIKVVFAPIADGVWHSTTIPIAAFTTSINSGTGGFNNRKVAQVNFVLANAGGPDGTGSVHLDNFEYVDGGGTSVQVLDTYSLAKDDVLYSVWSQNPSVPFPFSIVEDDTVPGSLGGNRVGRLDFTIVTAPASQYGGVLRSYNANLLAESALRFRYKGTGANANVEVKLVDADGTVYRRTLKDASSTGGEWKTVTLPRESFAYVGGANNALDLKKIHEVQFVLTRGQESAGVFYVDTLETVTAEAVSKSGIGKVLTSITVPNNPFSPNGDGRKDTFPVQFNLSESARVLFKVINLQGVPVLSVDLGDSPAGDQAFEWDGIGDDGNLVMNGIYFFFLEAQGSFSGSDLYKQVVSVVR